jgi:5-methylcytosine-specific restriction endonuclease McrA
MEYGGICPYCNEAIVKGHVDHIIPVCKGGTNERENLAWVCQRCNAQKGSRSLLQFVLLCP